MKYWRLTFGRHGRSSVFSRYDVLVETSETSVTGGVAKGMLNLDQPIEFCNSFTSAAGTSLDVPATGRDGEVSYKCIFCFT